MEFVKLNWRCTFDTEESTLYECKRKIDYNAFGTIRIYLRIFHNKKINTFVLSVETSKEIHTFDTLDKAKEHGQTLYENIITEIMKQGTDEN